MRTDNTHQAGRVGLIDAMAAFARIGWGPVPNPEEDLGTDLLIFARDNRQFDRGLIVGAQVKGGPSYFDRPGRAGGHPGWWYAEPDIAHFTSWVEHALPHLMVLVDIDSRTAYWQHITAERVQSTGGGAKIFVPRHQVVDEAHLDELMACAKSSRPIVGRRRGSVSPGQELRTALVAPFLLRPRRSKIEAGAPAIEFIAMLLSGRPTIGLDEWQGPRRATWMTRLAKNIFAWVTSNDDPGFVGTADAARRHQHRTAALVLQSAHLRDQEDHRGVIALLSPEILGDRNSPTDHAWLSLQRARSHFELGDYDAARDDALAAVQAAGPVAADDVVEIAITRAAAWLVFQVAGQVTEAQIRLASSDDDILSWRQEHITDAAVRMVDDVWAKWVDARSIELVRARSVERSLYFAELNADLVGDHVGWAQALRFRSRSLLVRANHEPADIVTLVDMLRRSGDRKGTSEIVARLQRLGPIEPLATVVRRLVPVKWSRRSAEATVELLQGAGQHFLEPAQLLSVATDLCRSLAEPGAIPALDWVSGDSRRRLLALLLQVSDARILHRKAADLVLNTSEGDHGSEELAGALTLARLDARRIKRLRELAHRRTDHLGTCLLGTLTRAYADPSGIATLVERADGGDTVALDIVTNLPDGQAEKQLDQTAVVRMFEERTKLVVANADRGVYAVGGDNGRALVLTSVRFGQPTAWPTVQLLLASTAVASRDKLGALRMMIDEIDRISPETVRKVLAGGIPINHSGMQGLSKSAVGAVTALQVTADRDAHNAARLAARLLNGDVDEQTDLARLIGLGYVPALRPTLRTLVNSESSTVLQAAALAVGQLARSDPSGLVDDLVAAVAVHDRITSPFWYLRGLHRSTEPLSAGRRDSTIALIGHPSKVIQWAVSNVIERGL